MDPLLDFILPGLVFLIHAKNEEGNKKTNKDADPEAVNSKILIKADAGFALHKRFKLLENTPYRHSFLLTVINGFFSLVFPSIFQCWTYGSATCTLL